MFFNTDNSSNNIEKYTLNDNGADILKNLMTFFKEDKFCDITLIARNGDTKVKAHRLVLAAASEYFSKMFGSSFKEAEAEEVEFDNIDGETLNTIISSFYTNSIELQSSSVEDIFKAAHFFQLKGLEAICCEYMKKQLDASNCLGITLFAEKYNCKALYEASHQLTMNNFTKLRENPEFYLLNMDQLSKFLSSNDLRATSEEEIFHCLMSWIDHDRDNRGELIAKLLKHIRLALLQPRFIADVVEQVCQSHECKEIINSAFKWHALPRTGILREEQIQLRSFKDVLIAVSGWDNEDHALRVGLYYCGYDDWIYREWPVPPHRRSGFGGIVINGKLIIAGGNILDVDCLDLRTLRWAKLPPIPYAITNCHMCILKGDIYLMGKIPNSKDGRAFKLNPSIAQWEQGPGICTELYPLCSCVTTNLVSYFNNASLQSYCTVKKCWTIHREIEPSIKGICSISINNINHLISVYPNKISIGNFKADIIKEIKVNLDFANGCTVFKNQLIVYGKGVFKKFVNGTTWEWMPTLANQQGEVILLSC